VSLQSEEDGQVDERDGEDDEAADDALDQGQASLGI